MLNKTVSNHTILEALSQCQHKLHTWGEANQVSFEPSKESFHILDRAAPVGNNFEIIGVVFDTKLQMHDAAARLTAEAGWRIKAIVRTMKFYDAKSLIRLYKCHVLSFLEAASPACAHAAPSVLKPIDDVQIKFLEQIGVSDEQALLEHCLAPLAMRREIGLLGLLHKVALGSAPAPIKQLFDKKPWTLNSFGFKADVCRHDRQLHDPIEPGHSPVIRRSIFGMVRIYNALPQSVVALTTVKSFQRALQRRAREAASDAVREWQLMYSPCAG